MARANTRTLLPLDRFASLVGLHPLHFNQVELPDLAPATTCGQPMVQWAWQAAAAVGREELAEAIARAEDTIARELGYQLLPTWQADEQVRFTEPAIRELYKGAAIGVRGKADALKTLWGYVQSGGIEAKTLIDDAVVIVYSDADTDGYKETATISVPTTVTLLEEIAIYYPGKGGDSAWEVRPITVSITGGVATIVCRREQLVIPSVMESFQPRSVSGLDDTAFLTTVDVYRHWNDPSQQVSFLWEPIANSCGCYTDTCETCVLGTQTGCMYVKSTRQGLIGTSAAEWDATLGYFTNTSYWNYRAPDRARLWYRAGWKDNRNTLPNIQMDRDWALIVARLAVTYLDRVICSCQNVTSLFQRWTEDMAHNVATPASSSSFRIPQSILNNPIGTTRAALDAWRKIQRERLGEGVVNV